MLRRLRIKNFKGWPDTGELRLAPLTIFFGPNSSGKSSLLQFLLMLRQTAESPDRRRVLHLGDRTTPVELGTYRDIIFESRPENKVEFAIEWSLPERREIRDEKNDETFVGDRLAFDAVLAADEAFAQPYVERLRYTLSNGSDLIIELTTDPRKAGRDYHLTAGGYRLVRSQGRKWPLPAPERYYGFPDETNVYFQNAAFTSDLALELERQVKRVQYLGPLRQKPERIYLWSGEHPEHVGWAGENTIAAFLASEDRNLKTRAKQHRKGFQDLVGEWLKRLGVLDEFEVKAIAPKRKEFEAVVKARRSGQSVNLPDVGFGVSQVLPVVVEVFYAQPHATVLLEQPEIHLHPRVQTELADLFIEAIHAREGGRAKGVQLIVESHSEHFLQRLQRRVAEGEISPDEVALYFCSPGPNGCTIEELRLNLLGDIENWPDDFFGDEMGELAKRMDAAAKRRAS